MKLLDRNDPQTISLPLISADVPTLPSAPVPPLGEKAIWRSLDDLANTPEFQAFTKKEFPGFANVYEGLGEVEVEESSLSRRNFIALSAAGLALAGLAGCRRPDLQILPYSHTPEDIVPGVSLFYATSLLRPGGSFPVLVESHEGRPTKIEGNPKHPASLGRTDTYAQAAILDLYSQDRSKDVITRSTDGTSKVSNWESFDRALAAIVAGLKEGGEGLRFLAEDINSPALRIVREQIATKFPKSVWHTYEPVSSDSLKEGAEKVFGKPYQITYDFKKAKRVLALDADFLGSDENTVVNSQGFADSRKAPEDAKHDHGHDHGGHKHDEHAEELADQLSRLYVIESGFSITGTMADHRLRLPSSHILDYVVSLAKLVGEKKGDAALKAIGSGYTPTVTFPKPWLEAVAEDLMNAHFAGKSLVLAGTRQPAVVHSVCLALNQALGSIGETVLVRELPASKHSDIKTLSTDMAAGKVSTLFVLGGNPVYNAPADLDFSTLMGKVATTIHLGLFQNETSDKCTWHLPAAHVLESWGDAETLDGTYGIVQPMIAPLHGGRSFLELLIQFSGFDGARAYADAKIKTYELVRKSFALHAGKKADDTTLEGAFKAFVQKGYVDNSARKPEKPALTTPKVLEALKKFVTPKVGGGSYEICFYPAYSLFDGRFATNSWMMEWPDPITKLVWDNAAIISPKTATKLGIPIPIAGKPTPASMIEIQTTSGKVKIPTFVLPGQTDDSIAVTLGYAKAGTEEKLRISRIPEGGGFNVYPLRSTTDPYFVTATSVTKIAETYQLVTTQEHGIIPDGKEGDILHEYSTEKYEEIVHGGHGHTEGKPEGGHAHEHKDDPKSRFQFGYKVSAYRGVEVNSKNANREQSQIKEEANKTSEDISYPARLEGHMQWGMVIDLNTCTGCSACVIACQAENNIPVVGKNEVRLNREMHWIRLDRYFTSKMEVADDEKKKGLAEFKDEPHIVTQPMMCQQCEAAPCESVCPVNAAVHSPEGLNLQVYNRCIGTRYCSNNCPYKVRRFNWFDFNKRRIDELRVPTPFADAGVPETLKMQKNPEVTVRMRGVMEKCTYCIQRIERAKIGSKVLAAKAGMDKTDAPLTTSHEQEYRLGYAIRQYGNQSKVVVPDGIITPACAQACPSKAIVFGNVNDEKSKVFQMKNSRIADYLVLGLLNTKPRTSYLPRLRNLNEKMKEATA